MVCWSPVYSGREGKSLLVCGSEMDSFFFFFPSKIPLINGNLDDG